MRKNLQLFHDMVTKGVNQLLGDPNYEWSQWLMCCYCWQTTGNANCAQGENSKWEQLIYLWQVNFKVIFKKYSEMNAISAVLT